MVNAIYDKSTANIFLKGNVRTNHIKIRNDTGLLPTLPLFLNTVIEAMATAVKQEKEIRGINIKKAKMNLFANYIL